LYCTNKLRHRRISKNVRACHGAKMSHTLGH
jgi:hypothetical protein